MTAAQISTPLPEAARRLIDGMCGFDIDKVVGVLCDTARLSAGSETYAGKPGVRKAVVQALGWFCSIRCEPAVVWMNRNVAVIEADIECERLDRAHIAFPLTMVLRFRDHLISEIRLVTYAPAFVGSLRSLRRPA